jgi:hypothetical protein
MASSELATWAAAAIALAAMGVAVWQASEATKSRKAAAAGADAARAQAEAAAAQLAIMRADRDDRSAPQFEVAEAVDCQDEVGHFAAKIKIRMESGPSLASVKVTPHGTYLGAIESSTDTFFNVRPGGLVSFTVSCDDGYVGESGSIDLVCKEDAGEHRVWHAGLGFVISPTPPKPFFAATRR